ncbi:hypothetical protein MUP50_00870 [Patescibacteria group bacterium]|nr:hypothetical protein [Patescibacteria group bacterium]
MDKRDIIYNRIIHAKHAIIDTAIAVDWRTDRDARQAREELVLIKNSMRDIIDPNNPPRVLDFIIGDKEYVSIRRIQGADLYISQDVDGDAWKSKTIFAISKDKMPEGTVGLLFFPDAAECLNEDILKSFPEEEALLLPYFDWVIANEVPYKQNDWKINFAQREFIKRIGDSFYRLNDRLDKFDHLPGISRVKPVNSKIFVGEKSFYINKEELKMKRDWYDTRARFYVLMEGSSKKDTIGENVNQVVPKNVLVNAT